MIVLDILGKIAVIVASITAIYGVNSWRREFKWKKKIELTEEILSLFYECRDKIRMIRSPYSRMDEGTSRKSNPEETEAEKKIFNRAYVIFERYFKEQSTFNKLSSLKYRFMVYFGSDKEKHFDDLRKTLNEILISAEMLGTHYWQRQGHVQMTEKEREIHLNNKHENEANIWEDYSKPDKISGKVNKIIFEIEEICSKFLIDKN